MFRGSRERGLFACEPRLHTGSKYIVVTLRGSALGMEPHRVLGNHEIVKQVSNPNGFPLRHGYTLRWKRESWANIVREGTQ